MKKKKVIKSAAEVTMIAATMSLTSCEFMAAFAEGLAQGMASYNYYNPYGYGSYNSLTSSYPSYSLDPNVVWNQAVQEVAQQQQTFNNLATQTWNQAVQEVEQERQRLYNNLKNQKKADGSAAYTEEEIQQIMNNTYAEYAKEMGYTSSSQNGSNQYNGKLSPSQYEEMYRKYEKSVQDWFNGLTINGSKGTDSHGNINGTVNSSHYTNGGTYSSAQTGMKNAQKEMRRIREEAAQYGVFIQQSKWETATAGY